MLLEYWIGCLVAVALGVCLLMLCFECVCLVPALRRRRALVYGTPRPAELNVVPGAPHSSPQHLVVFA